MSALFSLELSAEGAAERIERLTSFTAADASGSFGILAGHEPLVTVLQWGLCSYRLSDGTREYLAVPGGVLYFAGDVLHLATRRYLRAAVPEHVLEQLEEQMRAEAASTRAMHDALQRLDRELLRRLLAR